MRRGRVRGRGKGGGEGGAQRHLRLGLITSFVLSRIVQQHSHSSIVVVTNIRVTESYSPNDELMRTVHMKDTKNHARF